MFFLDYAVSFERDVLYANFDVLDALNWRNKWVHSTNKNETRITPGHGKNLLLQWIPNTDKYIFIFIYLFMIYLFVRFYCKDLKRYSIYDV